MMNQTPAYANISSITIEATKTTKQNYCLTVWKLGAFYEEVLDTRSVRCEKSYRHIGNIPGGIMLQKEKGYDFS
jgi:hypothetical protein